MTIYQVEYFLETTQIRTSLHHNLASATRSAKSFVKLTKRFGYFTKADVNLLMISDITTVKSIVNKGKNNA